MDDNQCTAVDTPIDHTRIVWEGDSSIAKLSKSILQSLAVDQLKQKDTGEFTTNSPIYSDPTDPIPVKVNQQIWFNIIRHRNSDSSTPTLSLFQSFASALHDTDHSLTFLPISSSKQDLPALSNKVQIKNVDNNRILTYFKPYFTRQHYSLSGYMYISSAMTLEELKQSPAILEWLECNRYSIKPSPSNDEEMVQVGALCFGSECIYREDLKEAICKHSSWVFPLASRPPVLHLTKGDFKGPKKSTKMIFVCTERSRQLEVAGVLTNLYDGTTKEYPNRIMLIFFLLHDNIQHDSTYLQQIIYNHEKILRGRNSTVHSRTM